MFREYRDTRPNKKELFVAILVSFLVGMIVASQLLIAGIR